MALFVAAHFVPPLLCISGGVTGDHNQGLPLTAPVALASAGNGQAWWPATLVQADFVGSQSPLLSLGVWSSVVRPAQSLEYGASADRLQDCSDAGRMPGYMSNAAGGRLLAAVSSQVHPTFCDHRQATGRNSDRLGLGH